MGRGPYLACVDEVSTNEDRISAHVQAIPMFTWREQAGSVNNTVLLWRIILAGRKWGGRKICAIWARAGLAVKFSPISDLGLYLDGSGVVSHTEITPTKFGAVKFSGVSLRGGHDAGYTGAL